MKSLGLLQPTEEMKSQAAKVVLEEIGKNLARLDTPDSGRLLESSLQLLPDPVFRSLAYLVIGNESNDLARNIVFELVFRIASKLGLQIDDVGPVTNAAGTVVVVINAENLRRKGHMEYLAPDNIFVENPKHPGYNKLTESGKDVYYKEVLDLQTEQPKYLM